MTHLNFPNTSGDPFERCNIQFQQAHAIVWQIKFILSSKKPLQNAQQEFAILADQYGRDFDKYLLRHLIEIVEIKESGRTAKDKSEAEKVQLLSQELTRASMKPEFLSYFFDILKSINGGDISKQKMDEFLKEITKRLKLNSQIQLLIALSILESAEDDKSYQDALALVKQKLEYLHSNGKPEQLPDYAIHRILFLFDHVPELANDPDLREPKLHMIQACQSKFSTFTALRGMLHQDTTQLNCHPEQMSINILREGGGIENLSVLTDIVKPWEILLDLGHGCSNQFETLMKVLQDFKNMDEKTMGLTILYLSINHSGKADAISKIILQTFEQNKEGFGGNTKKDIEEKKQQVSWNLDVLARGLRESTPTLNWGQVLDNLGEVTDQELPEDLVFEGMDGKQFQTFMLLYQKCRGQQNQPFPLQQLLSQQWKSPHLQLQLIRNAINHCVQKKDKTLLFSKLKNRVPFINDFTEIKERGDPPELIEVWQSVDLLERLIALSEKPGMFMLVRRLLDHPLKQLPEYLLLSLSLCKPKEGHILIDELLSILLPIFLGNHSNSSVVLQKLFDFNKKLFIRGICELCRHDQKLMNLSRVLDITQEVKESLLEIINCEDYPFAVKLGILSGKRDFLHYDTWIQTRIKDVGTPFVEAVIDYIQDQIINPVSEFVKKNQQMAEQNPENFETQKTLILEGSHLSKEKFFLTLSHLQNADSKSNSKINKDTPLKIQDILQKSSELFPQHYEPGQNSEEIEQAANELFQTVFLMEDEQETDQRIDELIHKLESLQSSKEGKDQELYACMLHGLFDEYRFLHKYPGQYLTKISKIFGAILKTNLLDRNLQDIALKFVIEAYRREGKRQKFSIIVINKIIDNLHNYPQFLEDIYQVRDIVREKDPQMVASIERIYHQVFRAGQLEDTQAQQIEQKLQMSSDDDRADDEDASQAQLTKKGQQKGNLVQKDKLKQGKKLNQASISQSQQSIPSQKNITQPIMSQAKEFIPTSQQVPQNQSQLQQNLGSRQQVAQPMTQAQIMQVKAFVPSGQSGNQQMPQPSQMMDHMGMIGINQQQMNQFKMQQMKQNQKNATSQQNPGSGLNIKSAEFQRPNMMVSMDQFPKSSGSQERQISLNSKSFTPFSFITQRQVQLLLQIQKTVNDKIQKSIETNQKLRFTDLLDDDSIKVDDEFIEDQIRLICNQTDKSNFKQKIQDLKKLVLTEKTDQTKKKPEELKEDEEKLHKWSALRWFIQIILTRRLGSQNATLLPIYAEMIRELNILIPYISKTKSVLGLTLYQASLILKKCLIINEDELSKVLAVAQGSGSVVKSYLASLGSFIGMLTLAKNEPIRNINLDLKQILVEAFPNKNRRLAVTFVCRILKETSQSKIFSVKCPWMTQLLQMLKDISEQSQSGGSHNDCIMEVESLFKALSVPSSVESKTYQLISTSQNPIGFKEIHLRKEVEFLNRKYKIILPPASAKEESKQNSKVQQFMQQVPLYKSPATEMSGSSMLAFSESESFKQSISQIDQKVKISPKLLRIMHQYQKFNEKALRTLIGMAVDNSIVEILPAVIDRAVTIAKITTTQIVIKDFAYDGDYIRLLRAADLIVQNLAGSLGLVTCRGPLNNSLQTNLKFRLDQYLRKDLGLEVVTFVSGEDDNDSGGNSQGHYGNNSANEGDTEFQSKITQKQFNKIVEMACTDNLDLCCRLTKKEVTEKARRQIRQDPIIIAAVEQRKVAQERGIRPFRDPVNSKNLSKLPQELQPDFDGLTDAQLQVYEDFGTLGMSEEELEDAQIIRQNPSDLTGLLNQVEQLGLQDNIKQQLLEKLQQLAQSDNEEDKEKLWIYVQRTLETIVKNFDARNPLQVEDLIQVLSFIVGNYKGEDLSVELLKKLYLILDVRYWSEVDLNILLVSRKIISIQEWDNLMSMLFKQQGPSLPEDELQFFHNFLVKCIVQNAFLTRDDLPQLLSVMEQMVTDSKIGGFCKNLLEIITLKQENLAEDSIQEQLKTLFLKWTVISCQDIKETKDKMLSDFIKELEALNFEQDPKTFFIFCRVMVATSIERCLVFGDGSGEIRAVDRLDFRYVDSLIQLIELLLKMFSLNKHEFFVKILEFVGESLDEQHKNRKAGFNQRPFFKVLLSLIHLVNSSDQFNLVNKRLVLFSMADLFKSLSPSFFPGFSFAWIELISNREFLPFFLNAQPMQVVPNQNQLIALQGLNMQQGIDQQFFEKRNKMKELFVAMFLFLKINMTPREPVTPAIQAFYLAVLRVITVVRNDFPDFLSDFHFHFVNSLPDHCIQLRNLILSACPSHIQQPDPFKEDLKIDLLAEMEQTPRILSNFDNYLSLMNLRQDLENYAISRNPQIIIDICQKMEQSEEIVNGKRRINSNVIGAVVLFLAHQGTQRQQANDVPKPSREIFKQIVQCVNDETRWCFLNAIVNELRYPSKHTFAFSCNILHIYSDCGLEKVQEDISKIILERLQVCGPHPWGLLISFREFIQNKKFDFMNKNYIREHEQAIVKLFRVRLNKFLDFTPASMHQRSQIVRQQSETAEKKQ